MRISCFLFALICVVYFLLDAPRASILIQKMKNLNLGRGGVRCEIRILLLEVGENSSKIAYPICENERLASRGGNARAKETPHKQNPGESLVLLPIRRRCTFFRLVFNQVREGLYSARTGITQLPTKTLGGSFRRAVKIRIKFFLCQIN